MVVCSHEQQRPTPPHRAPACPAAACGHWHSGIPPDAARSRIGHRGGGASSGAGVPGRRVAGMGWLRTAGSGRALRFQYGFNTAY